MALSANTVFEIRSTATASNANGGGFVTGASGVDYSQQDAAQYNLTGATSAGADAIILHASAAADMVGNIAHVISGTNATAGWYEITAVDPGVSITVDRNWGTGAVANGVVNIGGALSLGSSDDAVFELPPAGGGVKYWIKSGTYTLGGAVAISQAGGTAKPNVVEGYAVTRGDSPKLTTRPVLVCGASIFASGSNWNFHNLEFQGTSTQVLSLNSGCQVKYCKITNSSLTANRAALVPGTDNLIMGCEAQSANGYAMEVSNTGTIVGCYIHDSVIGIHNTGTGAMKIIDNLIICNKTTAINCTGSVTNQILIYGNTLYGFSTPTGTGVALATGITDTRIINNIISGFVTGVTHADTQTVGVDEYNDYYNNTGNATNWTLGSTSVTTNPAFTGVAQINGTTASTSGSVLTQSGGDFSSVTDNQDYLYLISGTGVTAAMYPITSHTATTVTLGIAPGTNATTDKAWRIVTGRDFTPTASIASFPVSFYGSGTDSSSKMGASQPASSGGSSRANRLGFGVFS